MAPSARVRQRVEHDDARGVARHRLGVAGDEGVQPLARPVAHGEDGRFAHAGDGGDVALERGRVDAIDGPRAHEAAAVALDEGGERLARLVEVAEHRRRAVDLEGVAALER